MKIARLQTPGFIAGWVVLTPPTFKIIHPSYAIVEDVGPSNGSFVFDDIDGILPAHSGLVVECRLVERNSLTVSAGFTACSPTDEFNLGTGIKHSLERAFANLRERVPELDKEAIKEFYDQLLASKPLGDVFRGGATDEAVIGNDELVDAIVARNENLSETLTSGFRA